MKLIDTDGCLWSSVLVITQQDWFGVLSNSLQGHCFQTIWFLVIVFYSRYRSLFPDYLVPCHYFLTIWIQFIVSRLSGSWWLFYDYLVPGQCFLPVSISGFWSLFPVKLETVQCFLAIRILVNASHIYHYLVPGYCFWLSISRSLFLIICIKVVVFWLFGSRSLFSDSLDQGHCFLTVWI